MSYIEEIGKPKACFLCENPAKSPESDSDTLLLVRGKHAFVTLNLYPYNLGHLVIAPYAHIGRLQELTTATSTEMTDLANKSLDALEAEYQPDGFNVGMNLGRVAGAGVPDHLHEHIVPRWGGDANFMTTVGETKTLPESLQRTYERLRPRFS